MPPDTDPAAVSSMARALEKAMAVSRGPKDARDRRDDLVHAALPRRTSYVA